MGHMKDLDRRIRQGGDDAIAAVGELLPRWIPVSERLVTHVSLSQSLLNDNEKLRSEIASLREAIRRLAEQDATLSVQGGNVTVTMDATLTDEEREAIVRAVDIFEVHPRLADDGKAATLRGVLERTKAV